MRVVGLDQIDAFLASRADCRTSDALKAFIIELGKRTWKDAPSMARDYPLASFHMLPEVLFHLTPCAVTVGCHIDFLTSTVLIECCKPGTCRGESQCRTTRKNAA
jgi:hypothetical protein